MGRKKVSREEEEEMGEKSTELKRLTGSKDKIRFRKSSGVSEEETSDTTVQDKEARELTEKLKTAFHEKPKEDEALQKRKELDGTIRGFRKSFRKDVASGVRQHVDMVVTEVKQSITTIKDVAKTKKKGKDVEEPSVSDEP